MLLAPGSSAPDQATNGSFVAEPCTPDSAMFENPSGLVRFERTTLSFSAGLIEANTELKSRAASYDRNDTRYAFLPSGGISIPLAPGWRAGMGFYGSVGTTFDFEASWASGTLSPLRVPDGDAPAVDWSRPPSLIRYAQRSTFPVVIRSFRCKDTADVFRRERRRKFASIAAVAVRKLVALHAARELRDLRVPPGNELEPLKGDRLGQYSIRVNKKFRICFIWKDGGAENVEIVDYH